MIRFKRGTICLFPFPTHKLVPFQIFQLYLDHKLFKISISHSESISTVSFSSSSFTQNLLLTLVFLFLNTTITDKRLPALLTLLSSSPLPSNKVQKAWKSRSSVCKLLFSKSSSISKVNSNSFFIKLIIVSFLTMPLLSGDPPIATKAFTVENQEISKRKAQTVIVIQVSIIILFPFFDTVYHL